jgi:hypothetical protein
MPRERGREKKGDGEGVHVCGWGERDRLTCYRSLIKGNILIMLQIAGTLYFTLKPIGTTIL